MGTRVAKYGAAGRAVIILRYLLAGNAPDGQQFFRHLRVTVRGGNVYKGSGLLNDELGSLAGARAGVLETRQFGDPPTGLISSDLICGRPKLGTVFVHGGGTGQEVVVQLRQAYAIGLNEVWAQVLQEIGHFNRLADAAGK
jgi:hypothetical protein